jgi:uncharacterized membrane protein YgcG
MGIDAVVVECEVDMALGLPYFNVVGLPEGAVRESKVRVVSALKNTGFDLPQKRITVNLAPADIRKEGAAFELPIAGHGGMMETAEMMYWEPTPYAYIRPIYKTVPFDGTRFEGPSLEADLQAWKAARDARAARASGAAPAAGAAGGGGGRAGGGGGRAGGGGGRGAGTNPDGSPRVNNGLSGNPHPATKAIGKDLAEIGITNTVTQVRALLAAKGR